MPAIERLFVYGTLRDPMVQRRVIGRFVPGTPATLAGYSRVPIVLSGDTYWIVEQDTAGTVDGLVLELTPEELEQADIYETSAYQRIRVTLLDGSQAWVYAR